MRSPGRLPHLG